MEEKQGRQKGMYALWAGLLIAQMVVILGSWLWSAAMPDSTVRSLLSESGIRWFFGTFIANLSCPLLAWIVLLDIAAGACLGSGLWSGVRAIAMPRRTTTPQQRSGLRAVAVLLIIEVFVLVLLTLPHHALLLSATGRIFPSSFSASIVPVIAAIITTSAVTFGLFSGQLHNIGDVFRCLTRGGRNLKAILVFYVFAIELFFMVKYVLTI